MFFCLFKNNKHLFLLSCLLEFSFCSISCFFSAQLSTWGCTRVHSSENVACYKECAKVSCLLVLFKLADRKDSEGFGMKQVKVPSDLVYNHPYCWVFFFWSLALNRQNLKLCILSIASRLQKKCSLHCAFYLVLLIAFCVDSATVLSRSLPLCCCLGEFLQLEDGSSSSNGKQPNFFFFFPFPVPLKRFTRM